MARSVTLARGDSVWKAERSEDWLRREDEPALPRALADRTQTTIANASSHGTLQRYLQQARAAPRWQVGRLAKPLT
jgi:hypothetical protein